MSMLHADGLAYGRGSRVLLAELDLQMHEGHVLGVIGPNGAGKTSLLRLLAGLEKPRSGSVLLDGEDIHQLRPGQRARVIGYHPQQAVLHWPMSVAAVVALGRYAHGASIDALNEHDHKAIAAAIERCGLAGMTERRADQLSGGELARVRGGGGLRHGDPGRGARGERKVADVLVRDARLRRRLRGPARKRTVVPLEA